MRKSNKLIVGIIVIVGLALAWYLASPLFINKVVNEGAPEGLEGTLETSTLYRGNFIDADSSHKVSGLARVIPMEDKTILRLEDFESTNGPDLKVYFSTDLDATEYVSLGALKGNVGNQNYEFSEEVDFEKYEYVLIWCERFSVLFGSARIGQVD